MKSLLVYLISICFIFPFPFGTSKNENPLVDITTLSNSFLFDIRYATSQNFLKEPVYDCAQCLLLPEVAQALINANYYFCDRGYQIQLYDCYRPLSVQQKMWRIFPNRIYVANPAKGSMHNRGAAVDLTLVTLNGEAVDMGTDYDFFGKAAHTNNYNLPKKVLSNRALLQEGLTLFGFEIIQSEWWHFYFRTKKQAPLLDTPFSCEK